MAHLNVWLKSFFVTLFIALLVLVPIFMVSDLMTDRIFSLLLPVVLVIGTPIFAAMEYRKRKKRKGND